MKISWRKTLALGALMFIALQSDCFADDKLVTKKKSAVPPAESKVAQKEYDAIEDIRSQLRAGKTAVLARALQFASEEEAAKFWPLYRQYQTDFAAINDRRIAIVRDFVAQYDTLDNSKAKDILSRSLTEQAEIVKLRQRYGEIISDEVSPMVAASFLQIDGVIQSLVDLELKTSLPLVADRLAAEKRAQAATTN